MVYDVARPEGSRVVELHGLCSRCAVPRYEPLRDDDSYQFITPTFMVAGGDGYTMIAEHMTRHHIFGERPGTDHKCFFHLGPGKLHLNRERNWHICFGTSLNRFMALHPDIEKETKYKEVQIGTIRGLLEACRCGETFVLPIDQNLSIVEILVDGFQCNWHVHLDPSGDLDIDVTVDYIAATSPIISPLEGRIRFRSESDGNQCASSGVAPPAALLPHTALVLCWLLLVW